MRKRAGRPRKLDAKRRGTTAERQNRIGYPVEIMRHRLIAAGVDEAKLADGASVRREAEKLKPADHNYPLDTLLAAGLLIAEGEDPERSGERHSVGLRFTALNWRIYGRPLGAQANGYRAPMSEEDAQGLLERANRVLDSSEPCLDPDERDVLAAMQYRALRDALLAIPGSSEVLSVTLRVLVYCEPITRADAALLRAGLAAMAQVRMPRAADAVERGPDGRAIAA